MATRIQLRRGKAATWASTNPVLGDGEPGYEKDTGRVKVGDGQTTWAFLPYTVDPDHGHDASDIGGLAKVATTGAYTDLTGTPTVPADLGDLGDVDTTTTTPTPGQALLYGEDGTWAPGDVTTTGGAQALDDLVDVDLTTPPTNGQGLIYSTGAGAWVPADPATGGATTLDGLDDVNTTTVIDGQVLTYDQATSTWVPEYVSAHTHTIDQVDGLTETLAGKAPTGHTHTLEELGAAPAGHTHTPDQVGAAPADHDHPWDQITDKPLQFPPADHDHQGYVRTINGQAPDTTGAITIETGGGGATTLDELTDVDTTGAATGQALVYTEGTGWTPGTVAGGEGGGGTDGKSAYELAVDNGYVGTETEWLTSLEGQDGTNGAGLQIDVDGVPYFDPANPGGGGGGGVAAPGTMVWRGAYDPATTYTEGDVVTSPSGLFIALEDTTGAAPALPQDPFADEFDRDNIGPLWQHNTGWVATPGGGSAQTTVTAPQALVKTDLTPDGTATLTTPGTGNNNDTVGLIFGYVDATNYYVADRETFTLRIRKIVNGTSTTVASVSTGYASPTETRSLMVTKTGGDIHATEITNSGNAVRLAYTDPQPSAGPGWGAWADPYSTFSGPTRVSRFEFTPALSGAWGVVERRWSMAGLDGTDQLATATDEQALIYDGTTHKWKPGTQSLDTLSDVATGTVLGGQVLAWDPTAGAWTNRGVGSGQVELARFDTTTVSANTTPTKGTRFTCARSGTITRARAKIDAVAGATYRVALYKISSATSTSPSVTAEVGSVDVPSPGAVTGAVVETPDVAWPIEEGQVYALVITDPAGGPIRGYYHAATVNTVFATTTTNQGVRTPTLPVTTGTTLDYAADGYCVGFTAKTGTSLWPDTLAALDDVDLATTAPTEGQTLIYQGGTWKPGTLGAAPASAAVLAIVHGTDPNTARPTAGVVHWYGSVEPVNALPRDEWIEETP